MIYITIADHEYGIVEARPKMMFYNLPEYSFSEITGIHFALYDKDATRIVYKSIDRVYPIKVIYNGIEYDSILNKLGEMEILYKKIEIDLALDKLE